MKLDSCDCGGEGLGFLRADGMYCIACSDCGRFVIERTKAEAEEVWNM